MVLLRHSYSASRHFLPLPSKYSPQHDKLNENKTNIIVIHELINIEKY
jgi:hypothetical protein